MYMRELILVSVRMWTPALYCVPKKKFPTQAVGGPGARMWPCAQLHINISMSRRQAQPYRSQIIRLY